MPPEYRVYVPPGAVTDFESSFTKIQGGEIKTKRPTPKDLSFRSTLTEDEVISAANSIINLLDGNVRIRDLHFWKAEDQKIFHTHPPQEWINFVGDLKGVERQKLIPAIAAVNRAQPGLELEDIRSFGLEIILGSRGIGKKRAEILRGIFKG